MNASGCYQHERWHMAHQCHFLPLVRPTNARPGGYLGLAKQISRLPTSITGGGRGGGRQYPITFMCGFVRSLRVSGPTPPPPPVIPS